MGFILDVLEADDNEPISEETLDARIQYWKSLYDRRDEFLTTFSSGALLSLAGMISYKVVGAPVTFGAVMSSPAPIAVLLGLVAGVIGGGMFVVSIFAVCLVVVNYRRLCARKVEVSSD